MEKTVHRPRPKRWGREGITPLMITFLLISLAVAVGVGVMNFGRAQVEENAECTIEIGLRLASVGGKEHLCYDGARKSIAFTVENGVNIDVSGLIVNVIGTEKAQTFELSDAKMGKAGSYVGKVAFDIETSGAVRQLKITPKTVPVDAEVICREQAVFVENVENC